MDSAQHHSLFTWKHCCLWRCTGPVEAVSAQILPSDKNTCVVSQFDDLSSEISDMSTSGTNPTTAAAKKPTRLIVTASSKTTTGASAFKDQLEARAARFGSAITKDSPDQDKLAARAARFAEVNKSQTAETRQVTSGPLDEDKLAKRAARFAGIDGAAQTTPVSASSNDILAKRAARFASTVTK